MKEDLKTIATDAQIEDTQRTLESNLTTKQIAQEMAKEELRLLRENAGHRPWLFWSVLSLVSISYASLFYVGKCVLFEPDMFKTLNDIWHIQAMVIFALAVIPTLLLIALIRITYSPIGSQKEEIKESDSVPIKALVEALSKHQ